MTDNTTLQGRLLLADALDQACFWKKFAELEIRAYRMGRGTGNFSEYQAISKLREQIYILLEEALPVEKVLKPIEGGNWSGS